MTDIDTLNTLNILNTLNAPNTVSDESTKSNDVEIMMERCVTFANNINVTGDILSMDMMTARDKVNEMRNKMLEINKTISSTEYKNKKEQEMKDVLSLWKQTHATLMGCSDEVASLMNEANEFDNLMKQHEKNSNKCELVQN